MSETEFESPGGSVRLDAGRVVLDEAAGRVLVDGEAVPLRGKTFRLLRELMRRPGELVTKEQLLDSVWEGRPHSDAVITTAIKEVRKALGDTPKQPWAIETAHGRGYRFLLPVDVVTASAEVGAEAAPVQRPPMLWIAMAAIVLLLLGAWLLKPEARAPLQSVAVLPFDDMTIAGDHRWFADGLTEELLNELMKVSDLDVAARNSAARFANSDKSVSEIGAALRVSHVIEGSIRNAGDGEVRLTVQLIRTADDFHEWSQTWDRSLSVASALDIQQDISERVVALMQEPHAPPVYDPSLARLTDDAWVTLLKGRELVERRSVDGITAGLALLRETVALNPDLPQGHAALASAYLFASGVMQLPPQESLAIASQHAERALELDPNSVEALVALSFVAIAKGDPALSVEFADRALEIAPGYSRAHQRRGVALGNLGRIEEGYEALLRARQLDPLMPIILANLTHLALLNGRVDEAREAALDNIRWNPGNHLATFELGRLEMELGHYEQALVCLRDSANASPGHGLVAGKLGELYWRIGADERASNVAAGVAGWAPRAAVLVSQQRPDMALEGADAILHGASSGLTPLDIYYWAGDDEGATNWASRFLQRIDGPEKILEAASLPDNAVTVFIVLEAAGDELAAEFAAVLEQRMSRAVAEEARLFSNMLTAAQWYAWLGERDAALTWLDRMAGAGMVARELDIDPVFAWLRDDPEFPRIRGRMQQRADAVRGLPSDESVCGAE